MVTRQAQCVLFWIGVDCIMWDCRALAEVCVVLSVVLVYFFDRLLQLHTETTDQIFTKLLPEMCLWTGKSPLNFWIHLNPRSSFDASLPLWDTGNSKYFADNSISYQRILVEFCWGGWTSHKRKPLDFGADPKQDWNPEILMEFFATLW